MSAVFFFAVFSTVLIVYALVGSYINFSFIPSALGGRVIADLMKTLPNPAGDSLCATRARSNSERGGAEAGAGRAFTRPMTGYFSVAAFAVLARAFRGSCCRAGNPPCHETVLFQFHDSCNVQAHRKKTRMLPTPTACADRGYRGGV